MGQLNYSRSVPAAVSTKPATDSSNSAASTAFVQALIPAGVVLPYAGPNAPAGWLLCDGQVVSRATYPALFANIGTTYGVGDGATTFNLPDLRGEFIRGLDGGRGVDAGRALGTSQADELKSHSHLVSAGSSGVGASSLYGNNVNTNGQTNPTGGTETRPRNVAMNHIIKAV